MKAEQLEDINSWKDAGIVYNEPVLTDPSCDQYCVSTNVPTLFIMSQYEVVNPETGDMELRTSEVDLDVRFEAEMVSACEAFGVLRDETENALVAEFLFELGI